MDTEIGAWSLEFHWRLVLGAWSFTPGAWFLGLEGSLKFERLEFGVYYCESSQKFLQCNKGRTRKDNLMYFGVDYHPEQWVYPYGGTADDPEAAWKQDIKLMAEAGINVVRIGEFTWGLCEPAEGKYD